MHSFLHLYAYKLSPSFGKGFCSLQDSTPRGLLNEIFLAHVLPSLATKHN